jgi:Domain of unknown function (DUF4157)
MPLGTEQTATTKPHVREGPQVLPRAEEKQNSHSNHDHGGIYSHIRELTAANGAQEPPLPSLAPIFRSADFSHPVNDEQKARALHLLQKNYGNHYVQRVLAGETASSTGQSIPIPIQRAPSPASPGGETTTGSFSQLSHSSGQSLDADTQASMGASFGQDFSNVRVHDDSAAHHAAKDLNAAAFTTGSDIYFSQGAYNPSSHSGQKLIAHELTHVAQQSRGASGISASRFGISHPSDPLEQEADRSSEKVMRGERPNLSASLPTSSGPSRLIHRTPDPPPTNPAATGPAPTSTGPTAATGGASSAAPPIDPATLPLSTGRPDPSANTITFESIEVPGFKLAGHRGQLYASRSPLRQKRNYQRGNPDQRSVWRQQVGAQTSAVVTRLQARATQAHPGATGAGTQIFTAPSRFGRNPPRYFIGDLATSAREMVLPTWTSGGQAQSYDVDHIVELQLANWDTDTWPNTLANMELLESSVNQQSGSVIKTNIDRKVQAFIRATNNQYGSSVSAIKEHYDLIFNRAVAGSGGVGAVNADQCWTMAQIQAGDQVVNAVRIADPSSIGGPGTAMIFPDVTGGVPKQFRWPGGLQSQERTWLNPYVITTKNFQTDEGCENTDSFGSLAFNIPADDSHWLPLEGGDQPIAINRISGFRYAGCINKQAVLAQLRRVRHKRLSPIQVQSFDVLPDRGLAATGLIMPEIPLLRGASLDFELSAGDLRIFKEFRTSDFTFPSPFRITDCSVVVSAGTRSGFGVDGRVGFEIQRVGQGELRAGASTSGGLNLAGKFNFDSRLFDQAEIDVTYRDGNWSGAGRLTIGPNKVRGVSSASVRIAYGEGRLEANGEAQFSIPGIQRAAVTVVYSEAEGLTIGGNLQLAGNIPGIQSGSIEARVQQRPGGEGYKVRARGTAVPAIPGVSTTLTVDYDEGAITIEGSASYSRGMLSGNMQVGATNRPLDAQGNPAPNAEPANQLRAYGGGSLTVRIAPWLQGTIGVRILPNGEIEVSGAIGLPSNLEIFPVKPFNKNIFSINIDIPIVGVSVLGQRIGIFATIGGGLDVDAGIGPGQLTNLGLTITYNPAHEDQTHVTGSAQLVIPAHAGLRLFVRGGLGVGIPIVSATATLEVGASLGLEGAVTAGVQVDWMPLRGLILDARGEIFVQPKFKFDVTGQVLVEADLLLTTVELYKKRWNLAQFEYGSDLRFGVRFPIHYQEGEPFDISLNDVEFVVPQVDPMDLLTGLVRRIG